MNKYEIKDIKSGLVTHSYKAISPMSHHSEWGHLERIKPEIECTEEEKLEALEVIETIDIASGNTLKSYRLPQTYEVIVTDLTPEIEEEETKKNQIQNLRQSLKAILQKADADVTTSEVKQALLKFLRQALLKGDLD